jgi:hypothetical protein
LQGKERRQRTENPDLIANLLKRKEVNCVWEKKEGTAREKIKNAVKCWKCCLMSYISKSDKVVLR